MEQAFSGVDANHDGRIDAEQLLDVARMIGMNVKSVHHAQALITKYGSRGRPTSPACCLQSRLV